MLYLIGKKGNNIEIMRKESNEPASNSIFDQNTKIEANLGESSSVIIHIIAFSIEYYCEIKLFCGD